ncbi:hypothetical protein MKUB_53520 [Mycobacterium kubicae]|uniref:Uncharacterized protein n=1 Tax=Mycobacterium kubicae TaxID=120959 RepID=A0AAX1J469_9MYCO|nr:hypothetical protein [Mycobacterium kubicae]MCV7097783.1 hypothetical protein [Mycobacterium kubicae]ORV99559.1 hypothetical protein AWC13_09980 [Mycobacterium kubicae]QNI12731.1 hypothetical protein GAN18_17355 [Mycobacterium kubicae]QPI36244.1 hypothetical protein I2456_17075 [Mycobacterium kubicae]GFG67862.1 hypothetical protein MKUB_53520 [Mycobacterium kubicae]
MPFLNLTAIFGRETARQRLRQATQESFTVPTFSAPLDCTPWIIGGLWPDELSRRNAETETLANSLREDLQRIAASANAGLQAIGRTGMVYSARRRAEAKVIDEARALAVRRVESTMRHLHRMTYRTPNHAPGGDAGCPPLRRNSHPDMDRTEVLPAVRDHVPPSDMDDTQVIPALRDQTWPTPVISDQREEVDYGKHRLLNDG